MPTKWTVLVCLCGLLVASAEAQQAAPRAAQAGAQASVLLTQALAALTGGAVVSDVTLTGSATAIAGSARESGEAALKALATGQGRMDLHLTSGPRSEVVGLGADGSPLGTWIGSDSEPHPMAGHNACAPAAWFSPQVFLSAVLSSSGYVATYSGQASLNAAAVQHLVVAQQVSGTPAAVALAQSLSSTDVYLDAGTMLPVAITFNIRPDGNSNVNLPVRVQYSDYRTVNGAQVPFRLQKFVQNSLVLDVQVQTVAFNSGLRPAAFAIQQ